MSNYKDLKQFRLNNTLEMIKGFSLKSKNQKIESRYDSLIIKKNQKVVHVVPAYPPNLGGMEQRVKELVEKLHLVGIPVEVITSAMGSRPGYVIEAGVSIQRLSKLAFLETPISFRLPFSLMRVEGDLFHIHVAQPYYPIVAAFVAFLRHKPYIMHVRVIVETENFLGKILIYFYKKIFLKISLRGASKCIILTESYKNILIREYGVKESRIVTIPNATYFKVLKNPHKLIAKSNPVNLLAVGRLQKQKNYPFMLRVVAELQKFGDFRLTIVGCGVDEIVLKKYAIKLGIENNVIWKGRLEGKELEDTYENSDIFVHTAYFEGFGTVLIEAMAKGLPICASNVLGTIDVVEDMRNGLLCGFDEKVFAQNICKIVNNADLYSEISSNNLTTVLQYHWENILNRTVHVYNELYMKNVNL